MRRDAHVVAVVAQNSLIKAVGHASNGKEIAECVPRERTLLARGSILQPRSSSALTLDWEQSLFGRSWNRYRIIIIIIINVIFSFIGRMLTINVDSSG